MLVLSFIITSAAGYLIVDDIRWALYRDRAGENANALGRQLAAVIAQQRSAVGEIANRAGIVEAATRAAAIGPQTTALPVSILAPRAIAACLVAGPTADIGSGTAEMTCRDQLDATASASVALASDSHYDLQHPVQSESGEVVGRLVMRFPADPLENLVHDALPADAYAEVRHVRADGAPRALVASGNLARLQQGGALTVALGSADWTLRYWPPFALPPILSGERIYYFLFIVGGALLLGAAIFDLYRRTTESVRRDIRSLAATFRELRGGRLRGRHAMELQEFANLFLYVRDSGKRMVEEKERLRDLGFVDHLSRLGNRRHFEKELLELFERAPENGPSSVLILDLDRFKSVNDKYGHSVGDALITGFADALRQRVRHTDFLARIGGDEFCIIYRYVDTEQAKMLAQRLREDLPRQIVLGPDIVHELRWSGGLSTMTRSDAKHDDVLWRADQALILSKELGRNITLTYGTSIRGRRMPTVMSTDDNASPQVDIATRTGTDHTQWPFASR